MYAIRSYYERALIVAALAEGTSRLSGLLHGGDAESTAGALRALGVAIPDLPDDGGEIAVPVPVQVLTLARITSYNVCYTKLLRLVLRLQRGDEWAFQLLVRRFRKKLFSIAFVS